MRSRSLFAILLPLLFLGAQAGANDDGSLREAMPSDAKDKIATTEVVIPIVQDGIHFLVPSARFNPETGLRGLIFSITAAPLIVGVLRLNAEAAVKPLREMTADFDFDSMMQNDLKESMMRVSWLHADNFRVVKDLSTQSLNDVLTSSKESAVLVTIVDYRLSGDASQLTVATWAYLIPIGANLKTVKTHPANATTSALLDNSLYHAIVSVDYALPNATTDRDQNLAAWSVNQGAALRDALKRGAADLAGKLATDIDRGDYSTTAGGKLP